MTEEYHICGIDKDNKDFQTPSYSSIFVPEY